MKQQSVTVRITLHDGWEFSKYGDDKWYPARVPGTVHTDLQHNRLIPDPYYSCNEKELQWIGKTDWIYRKTFSVNPDLLKRTHVNLVFQGLDTYAKVFLNGVHILTTNNMFREWQVSCKELLTEGNNQLEIIFESAENRFSVDSVALGYPLPGGKWNLSRKAAYHFGWDWGPKFVTAGIWKPVCLEAWDLTKVHNVYITTRHVTNKQAGLQCVFSIESDQPELVTLHISDVLTGKQHAEKKVTTQAGTHSYQVDFAIDDPELWWTNGLGKPHVYELDLKATNASGIIFNKQIAYGIRTLEVVTEDDEFGKSLYIKLNGEPVFAKGANYIPQHSFVTEVTDEHYRAIVNRAVLSNMNMIRVWGGGIYEKDVFYDLCNRNGILVWQDFMFACAMYPGHEDFVENVRQEAIEQVTRLRNFSNIALWCGNNEVDEGWHNWGWQRSYKLTPADSATIWQGYKRIFHELLPDIVSQCDPGRYYGSTSPKYGWGRPESMKEGSAHYWGVWWGREPFEVFIDKVPRFMSEYGFQAMPVISSIRAFQKPEDDFLFSDPLRCHQKHPTGFETIDIYLYRENLLPKSVQEYIYSSQLVQAKGIGLAIEAHRRSKPRCMGTLYWQLNDCWPVTSWSGTDFFGNWKALQYTVRKLYDEILVSVTEHRGLMEIFLVSDRFTPTGGHLEVTLVNFDGLEKPLFSERILLDPNKSTPAFSLTSNQLRDNIRSDEWMIKATFKTDEGKIYRNEKFLELFGNLKLPPVTIQHTITPTTDGYLIRLKSDAFAAYVQLYLSDHHAWFDDNFFHMWPGQEKTVACKTVVPLTEPEKNLMIMVLNEMLAFDREI